MKDREIDEILKQAATTPHQVNPALLDRIASSIGASLGPVRPLPPPWLLTAGLAIACAAVALAGAAHFGLYGLHKLSALERRLIFSALGIQIWLAAVACVSERIPGSRRHVAPGFPLAAGSLAMLAIFAILFRDYGTGHFVSQGIPCLTAGLLHAIPAALASWFILKRGFAVNPVSAGLAAGTLAGLAGVTMLELHCPNLQAAHVMLWHIAVMPVSGAAGALLGRMGRSRALRS